METTETTRQQKVARQIQKDVSDIFLKAGSALVAGSMVTVSVVRISPDLSFAKVYLSVFPFAKAQETVKKIQDNAWMMRMELGKRTKNQLRIVPELAFYVDDSLEYAQTIENVLKD